MPDPVTPATPAEAPPAGSPEADAAAIAQFDAAMAADPDTQPLPEGEPPDTPAEPVAEAPPPETPPAGEETPPEGEAPPVEGEAPPVEPAAAAPPVEAAKPDAEIEAEIKSRGLKGDTATRFRELSNQVRELSSLRDERPALVETKRLHDQWQGIVAESTATAPQLQQALAYIQSVNSGDPGRLGIAAKAMLEEVKWAYGKLGWELPGVVDPLASHPDLAEAVEEGDMTKKGALEIAAARALAAVSSERTEADNKQQATTAAQTAAIAQINVLSNALKAADPYFAAKLPHLKPTVDLIKETLPPAQWPAAIERAYRALPNPAAPPPRARTPAPSPMPLRPTGGNASTATVRKFTKEQVDAGDPFDMGVREAS